MTLFLISTQFKGFWVKIYGRKLMQERGWGWKIKVQLNSQSMDKKEFEY